MDEVVFAVKNAVGMLPQDGAPFVLPHLMTPHR
jgi:hypothetical protein